MPTKTKIKKVTYTKDMPTKIFHEKMTEREKLECLLSIAHDLRRAVCDAPYGNVRFLGKKRGKIFQKTATFKWAIKGLREIEAELYGKPLTPDTYLAE